MVKFLTYTKESVQKKQEKGKNMSLNEFKDRLFDVLNDTDDMPIADIMVDDAQNKMKIYLEDGTIAVITCELAGVWNIIR